MNKYFSSSVNDNVVSSHPLNHAYSGSCCNPNRQSPGQSMPAESMKHCSCGDTCAGEQVFPNYNPGIPTRARTLSTQYYDKKAYCQIATACENEMYISTQASPQQALHTGDSVVFEDDVFRNTKSIIHQEGSARFVVNELGLYEITYELEYDQPNLGDTIFQLSCFLPSRHVETISCVPAVGTICKTTKLLLAPGTIITLLFVGTTDGGVDTVAVEKAVMTLKKLYNITLDLPPNPCCDTKDICREWLFRYSLTDAILSPIGLTEPTHRPGTE